VNDDNNEFTVLKESPSCPRKAMSAGIVNKQYLAGSKNVINDNDQKPITTIAIITPISTKLISLSVCLFFEIDM
jgi:hypothetical protein